jgi:hypothetical protein
MTPDMNSDEFHDQLAMQTDKRKILKLIDDGVIDRDLLANAPVYKLIQACSCPNAEPNEADRCSHCYTKYDVREIQP